MNIILFDHNRENLLPFTFMRPVAGIRCGIMTLAEKWEFITGQKVSFLTEDYLSGKFPLASEEENIVIAGDVFATEELWNTIQQLKPNEKLVFDDRIIAARISGSVSNGSDIIDITSSFTVRNPPFTIHVLSFPWNIFALNDFAIHHDFDLITKGKKTQKLSTSNKIIGDTSQLFIEEGAFVECATINTQTGPVYIGKQAEVMEGTMIRGPFALCQHSATKMGTKIYGATTIGPYSKVGGEVSNSVIFGYSNKAHDGFLGNSVIAEWCNIGADTNNSNLKNNYGIVSVYNYHKKDFIKTGQQFCGLMMADHSKAGINTMFNTGTVIGVSANIFGEGFPPKYIPSFSWGGFENSAVFKFEKAVELAKEVFKRRNKNFDNTEENILKKVFEMEMMSR